MSPDYTGRFYSNFAEKVDILSNRELFAPSFDGFKRPIFVNIQQKPGLYDFAYFGDTLPATEKTKEAFHAGESRDLRC